MWAQGFAQQEQNEFMSNKSDDIVDMCLVKNVKIREIFFKERQGVLIFAERLRRHFAGFCLGSSCLLKLKRK